MPAIRPLKAKIVAMALGGLALSLLPAFASAQRTAITSSSGKTVAPLTVIDRSGKAVHLSDFRGRIVVLNMWATWCAPCRAEMPTLERLAARYPKDVVVLAVSNDSDGWPAIDRFWRGQFPHVRSTLAPGPEMAAKIGALGLPYSLIVGRDGREIARVIKGTEWDKGEIAALIAQNVGKGGG